MAAPTPTARTIPDGSPQKDGFSTTITNALVADLDIWEKTVQPPGIEGGDAVDNTTMLNTTWRTMRPRGLKTLTEITATCAYDPAVFVDTSGTVTSMTELCNNETTITIWYPDGSNICFFGFFKSFIANENEEGTQPTGVLTVIPTNWDPTNNVEAAPVYTAAP